MNDMNRGYSGWSMSNNAVAAYDCGEMPKSKWTKKAIVAAIIAACDEKDLVYNPDIEKMTKSDLFGQFMDWSGWHHTSKYCNETDFYAVYDQAVEDFFEPMPAEQVAEREARRRAEREAKEAERARYWAEFHEAVQKNWEAKKALAERRAKYQETHGHASNTVAAYALAHPEKCVYRTSQKGNEIVEIESWRQPLVCLVKDMKRRTMRGFDAIEK